MLSILPLFCFKVCCFSVTLCNYNYFDNKDKKESLFYVQHNYPEDFLPDWNFKKNLSNLTDVNGFELKEY